MVSNHSTGSCYNETRFPLRARPGCSHTCNLPQVHGRETVHDLEFGILYPSPKPIFFPLFLNAGSHHVTNGMDFTLQNRLALNSQGSSYLCLPSMEIKGMHHHAQFKPIKFIFLLERKAIS